MPQQRFARFAWSVLAYNILVILWGAYVRATGSGAGCGSHWPLCNGEVIPRAEEVETLVEFMHRTTSGLALLMVVGMLIWALRLFPKGHLARLGASWSMILIIVESLLGAGLVVFGLVAGNTSVARSLAGGIHLINTLLLLGAITLTAWWAGGGAAIRLRGQGSIGWMLGVAVLAVLGLGATGAMTALGDTLFPSDSLRAGLAQDFDPTAHFLVRLRVWHPLLAAATGVYLLVISQIIARQRPSREARMANLALLLLFLAQLGIGTINLVLMAPILLQIIHLLLADLVWVVLVVLSALALADDSAHAELIRR
ncbi:protoheme IX farnesyltransferase [Oscillochloris trichoides DG-6]|uniref:Protoheme IX farnesyltransferase n=1 Tax=Oscillochloris trichoides DG-6 TaxID=765420 RepID=E1ICI9_9CHLR|nr:COX15/CtaA family protein [Oscillochloris trichoides]EFO81117.1 protoheme IX farnesyltransferase [Oscillochloris trichoides DG-6]